MKNYLIAFFLLVGLMAYGQNDTLRLKNNDQLVGEIKSVITGVLTMETAYSDDDFTIDMGEVREMIIERKCIILLTRGRDRFGYIRSEEPGKVTIRDDSGSVENVSIRSVIGLQEVEDSFWSRFKGSIDLGLNVTKASNAKQFNIAGRLAFTGRKWIIDSNINNLTSTQDDAEDVKRLDANLEALRLLPRDWFLTADLTYLQNTEQAIDARWSPSLAVGNLVVSTYRMYLGLSAGFNVNLENFVDSSLDKTSGELLMQAEFNMFDFEDLDLTANLKAFPSLTERGRFRSDFTFNISYDLPWDFYIKLGLTVNYDNQPAINDNQYDYIVKTGFGWSFND